MTTWNGNEENKKIKMAQHAKGRSQKQICSRHVDSVRVGSDQIIFCKGMKVRAYVHKYGTYRSRRPDISPERIAPDGITYVPKGIYYAGRIDSCAAAMSRVNLGDMNKSTHVWGNEFKE